MDLGTNDLKMLLCDSPLLAPSYSLPEYKVANLTTAQIVGKGTKQGNPTVDLIFVDEQGQKYVAMLTAALIDGISQAAQGLKERTSSDN